MTKVNLNTSGIYQITCLANSKIYIGSAKNIRMRWKLHRTHLRMGISHNKPMQKAWDKYGELFFSFEVLELCNADGLAVTEQRWLDLKKPFVRGVGFNVLATAYSSVGLKHSPEVIARLSEMAKKRDHSHLRKMSAAQKGKPGKKGVSGWAWTEAHKKAASERRKGRPAWNKGIPHTEEAKKRISESVTGINRTITDETRLKIKSLRLSGMSYPKIAREVGVSISQCHKIDTDNTGAHYVKKEQRSFEKVKGVA